MMLATEAEGGFAIVTLSQQALRTSKRHKWSLMTLRLPLSGKRHGTTLKVSIQLRLKPSSMMIWIMRFLQHSGQTNSSFSRFQCHSGNRPSNLGRSNRNWRSRKVPHWPPLFKEVCRVWTTDHQHSLPSTNSQQDVKNSLSLQTLAAHLLCHSAKEGQTGCESDKNYEWCWLLDRSQACYQQTQPAHLTCTATTRQESAKEIGCLQTETRQQEASIHQWCQQPFGCTEIQSREPRRELDRLQRHCLLFSYGFLRIRSRKHQDWFDENDEEIKRLLEEKQKKTRHKR